MEEKVIIKSKFTFIIFFIIVFGYTNIVAYAKTETDSNQEQQVEEINNNNEEANETSIVEQFKVDNDIYKVLKLDKEQNKVMFLKSEKQDDLEKIIVNNEVEYEGRKFKVEYIHENAFKHNKTLKNIFINDEVLGFCDLEGNFIETIDAIFQDQNKLESVNFGSSKFILGESCFQNCSSIKNIDLSKIRKFKGRSSFANCNKMEYIGEFNDEVTELPTRSFINCNMLKVNSLNNITKLGDDCFRNCIRLDQDIVTSVEEIGDNCFWGSSFREVNLEKAKKIGYNAFGGSRNLKKIKFGNPNIPIFTGNIAEGSSINEWVYPLKYKTQADYSEFLRNLRISEVICYYNYGNPKVEQIESVALNSLIPRSYITREGYELEGWYKEPECLNKVNKIADLGETSGSDIVIKDPKLYAKWVAKDVAVPKEDNPSEPEENNDPKDKDNPSEPEENNDPKEDNPSKSEDINDPKEDNPSKPEDINDPKEDNPSEPEESNDSKEEDNPSEPEENNDPKDEDNPSEPEDDNDPKDEDNPSEPEESNDPKEENNSGEPEDIHNLKYMDSISHKSKNNNNEIKINAFKSVSQHRTNNYVQIITSGHISKIIKNNKCIAIYLNNNDKLCYSNTIYYGYEGSIIIKGSNIEDKWYYMKDDESLVVNTCDNGYDITYYEKLI